MQNCLDGNFIYTIIILPYIVRKGAENIADFLSRIRHEESSNNVHYKNLTNEYCNFIISQAIPKTLSLAEIQEHTKLDNTLNLVVEALKSDK